ncbi:MAG TPA: multidrug DMT transporter permease [Lentisphaeria bacterium]|nr:MAG: multidrug DMT transporter permease [Lentisphaerae bacterium GWF2_38_69]HBM17184.1 multidrug DMT transporter permease [Lentisphaeria bacterium]
MVIITSYVLAVIMCVITMMCWGSWANTQKLVSGKSWPFQLFYWDYSIGVFVMAMIFALTMGSMGDASRPFFADMGQAAGGAIFSAFIGGVIFNLSNILLVIAIEIAGLAVAFPIGVGLALVIGVVANYIPDPVGNPFVLFLGVALVVLAIILSAIAYKKLQSNQTGKSSNVVKGVVVSLLAGILMGTFFRFVMASIGTSDYTKLIPGNLSPYSAIAIFSFGLMISSLLWNTINMYKPITGVPCTYKEYFTKGSPYIHFVGLLGGVIWCIGNSFSILASNAAGPSISYGLGQGATLIAAIWGVFIWKEFKNAPKGTGKILGMMFAGYVIGLILIIVSRYA